MSSLAATAELFQLFGEPTRVRLAALLSEHELTVAELVGITEIGQSRVSTHLGKLREAGVLRDRKVGANTFYSLNDGAMPEDARSIWTLVAKETKDQLLDSDRSRCKGMLEARAKAAAWPDALAGQMERHYSPGRTWEATARAFVGLMRLGDVLDIGSGDGTIAQLVASRARSITCLDRSEKMIAAARDRLAPHAHVKFAVADAEELPFARESFDEVLLFNVLTHAASPPKVLAESARVLRPRGAIVVVTLDAHDNEEITRQYHHVSSGFAPATLKKLLSKAGLSAHRCEVTSREQKPPHFQVVTAFAVKA
jgi:2-polyprenyl-3-methyl-5-hydroxy-6-metoxy-1,4-benzoquinol methylase/DNA-binding transcriptional ArsR family regulator